MQSFVALAAAATENLSPGQAPGSSASGNTTSPPSAGDETGSGTSGSDTSDTVDNAPAEQSANVASGLGSRLFFGLGAAAAVAVVLL